MPRWFKLTVAIAFSVAMTVQLVAPARSLTSNVLLGLLTLVAGAGYIGIGLYERSDRRTDEATTLDLTRK